ncbi:MAG: MacB family efflux pump subunit [Candidatus Omnitrophica bacterium CG11_big_fil_rev_8_21_14_0_20_63_9]|nr:MAG: MacB family efflux pump subunit [Candidatus Omnitrophica bacterium CG11_big_fil_rev_8_21_14_0_20_63_9]
MIELSGVHKTYQMGDIEVRALRGVSLTIEPGEFVAIMGPSGSGKSTLMHVLGLLDVPDGGSYRLAGREISRLSEDELAAVRSRTIGFVFQQFNLLPRTTAIENVAMPLLYSSNGSTPATADTLLRDVGLGERMTHRPNQLSGGQQQRVAIARALINHPQLIFADEPTGNLDSSSAQDIMVLLQTLNQRGITLVIVTHEPDVAAKAQRIIRMRDGVIQSDERVGGPFGVSAAPAASVAEVPTGHLTARELRAHVRQAVRALMANRVRTILSMLGILIGVAAVVAMLALGSGARESIETQLASMGSNLLVVRPGSRQVRGVALEAGAVTRLTLEDAVQIGRTIPTVTQVAPTVSGRGQVGFGNKNWSTQVQGTTPEFAAIRAAMPVVGRFFTEEEERMRARVAVVGQTVVRELFGDANPLGESMTINRVPFQVIGVLPEKGATTWRDQDDVIVIPLSTAMRRLLGKDYVDSIDVEVSEASQLEATQDAIEALIIREHRLPPARQETFEVRNMAEIQAALSETSRTMSWLLASIAAISLLVGGIGIMNIMLVSVTERTREIGLRKAVGARRRDILAQFLIEAVVISLAGGMAGILLGWMITLGMAMLAGWATTLSFWSIALAVSFSAGVGIAFGFWPARKAAALNPIDALRYE